MVLFGVGKGVAGAALDDELGGESCEADLGQEKGGFEFPRVWDFERSSNESHLLGEREREGVLSRFGRGEQFTQHLDSGVEAGCGRDVAREGGFHGLSEQRGDALRGHRQSESWRRHVQLDHAVQEGRQAVQCATEIRDGDVAGLFRSFGK